MWKRGTSRRIIFIYGKFKEVVDLLMEKNHSYEDYTEIIKDAIFKGINSMILEQKNVH